MFRWTILLACAIYAQSLWHAYDADKKYDAKCVNNTELWKKRTSPVSKPNPEKWKLWPELMNSQDEENGGTLYGFEEAMDAIWKNQHPEDCSKAKYLISGGFESGFGSEFHVLGVGLAAAMNLGRVYIMFPTRGDSSLADKFNSNNRFQVDIDYCKKQGNKMSLDCYYESWTQCTIEDAIKGTTLQTIRNEGRHMFLKEIIELPKLEDKTYIAQLGDESEVIPEQLRSLIECSPMHREKYRYWWRSVSAAYLMRPNEPTRQLIMKHREDPTMKFHHNNGEQCVSVYVRRGDKHLEMKLIHDETVFFNEAKSLWKTLDGVSQAKPTMFVGSEDPHVIDTAIKWGTQNNWEIRYSNLFDRHAISTHLNSTQQEEARRKNAFVHHEWEYFSMVLNIDAHIRCSAFVCTHRSNYCRLIDEMRATVGGKINRHYADFTCAHAPCIDSPDIGVDW